MQRATTIAALFAGLILSNAEACGKESLNELLQKKHTFEVELAKIAIEEHGRAAEAMQTCQGFVPSEMRKIRERTFAVIRIAKLLTKEEVDDIFEDSIGYARLARRNIMCGKNEVIVKMRSSINAHNSFYIAVGKPRVDAMDKQIKEIKRKIEEDDKARSAIQP